MAATPEVTAALSELIAVVARLRDPEGGCPWDREQTHASLVPYVLEEAHEVADAIRHGDDRHLAEELGDLLLQVVLHAQIANEEGRFDLAAIAAGLSAKLVRRHPHVFAEAEAADSAAVKQLWEVIKAEERGASGRPHPPSTSPLSDRLAGKVRGQPALAGAMTISKKAAAAGVVVVRSTRLPEGLVLRNNEVNDDEMPSVPILPNTESTPAAELFPDDMIDDEDTELIQESV